MKETVESIGQYLNPASGLFFAGQPVHCSQIPNLGLYTEHLEPSRKRGWLLTEYDRIQSYVQVMRVGGAQMVDVQMRQIVVTDLRPVAALFTVNLFTCTGIALHLKDRFERDYFGLAHIFEDPGVNLQMLIERLKGRFRIVDLAARVTDIDRGNLCTTIDSLSKTGQLDLKKGSEAERVYAGECNVLVVEAACVTFCKADAHLQVMHTACW